ncbi:hypothetical protein CDD81_3323 [Ophiocordyceps australis]|uniref:DNA polymerase epsilon subunit B n=1 Tax=Ophiocordyceps australis TaxID=1399860 RepID=A0A2C5XXE8_9HYPO|nr:hypothetical protein CDD81_3323 [Ophiocordyceps australis]
MDTTPAPIFRKKRPLASSSLPSSSPAFATPVHPPKAYAARAPKAAILPIILPPTTLRPLAFRTFTKKHSLTLTSSALQELAVFVGRHCGSGWREDGLAERVLEEVARAWKKRNGGVIVEGGNVQLAQILKTMEGSMSGGRVAGAARAESIMDGVGDEASTRMGLRPVGMVREKSGVGFGGGGEQGDGMEEEEEAGTDVRAWLKVVDAFEQPRLLFNVHKKHFERDVAKASVLSPPSHKTTAFRNRYHVIHQRLQRNEALDSPSICRSRKRPRTSQAQSLHLTPIANMLGRHGTSHMLLGLLMTLPTGALALSDLTGSIALDVGRAVAIPADAAWFCPGMIVLVDGVYQEDSGPVGVGLAGSSGIGGTLGGTFEVFFLGQPPCEKRAVTLGIGAPDGGIDHVIGGGFGWVDFVGVGSERAVGAKMARLQQRLLPAPSDAPSEPRAGRNRIILVGHVTLDNARALAALAKILALYAAEPPAALPLAFILTGNFASHAALSRPSSTSIEYKESFDALASVLAAFPSLLTAATFVLVPGDKDAWDSAFGAGAAVPLPRARVPDLFTSRVRRAFAAANAKGGRQGSVAGEAVCTTNPCRLTLFGPRHEVVVFCDDVSARLRRMAISPGGKKRHHHDNDNNNNNNDDDGEKPLLAQTTPHGKSIDERDAQRLVKSLLDQGHLAPFPPASRPLYWDWATALHLYPLPTALALVDASAPPFVVSYEGCHVMNPGTLLAPGGAVARWVEYEVGRGARVREQRL